MYSRARTVSAMYLRAISSRRQPTFFSKVATSPPSTYSITMYRCFYRTRGGVTIGQERARGGVTTGQEGTRGGVTTGQEGTRGGVTTGQEGTRGGVTIGHERTRGGVTTGQEGTRGGVRAHMTTVTMTPHRCFYIRWELDDGFGVPLGHRGMEEGGRGQGGG